METWSAVVEVLDKHPIGTPIRFPRSSVTHPVHAGLRRTVGVPRGQIADYRLPLGPDTWLHVTEYPHEYVVHRDVRVPRSSPTAPAAHGSGSVLGFFVGLALGGTIGAALTGLALGAVADAGSTSVQRIPLRRTGLRAARNEQRRASARKERK